MTRFEPVLLVAIAREPPAVEGTSALVDGLLSYHNGPVVANAKVVVVNWGEAAYLR